MTGRCPSRLLEIGAGYVVFDTYGQDRPQRYEIVQLSFGDQITLTDAVLSRVGQRSPTIVAGDPPLLVWQADSLLKALPAGPLEEVSMPLTGFSVRTGVGPYLWRTVDTIVAHLNGSVVTLDSTGAAHARHPGGICGVRRRSVDGRHAAWVLDP